MKDTDFHNLSAWKDVGGGFVPDNDIAHDIKDQSKFGQVHYFKDMQPRDLKFHRCYFSLLNFIYAYLPKKFKDTIPDEKFYIFIKHLKGEYEVLFEFNDGTKWIEYESIAFGNMSQKRFENYVREQLPWIYEGILAKYFKDELYDGIIQTIEDQYKVFLSKLND
jgi:hypothetical protein